MQKLTRKEAHLILAGLRVLNHLKERSPTPAELAELLEDSESAVRLRLRTLVEAEAVALVESAFETHVEICNYLAIEEFSDEEGPAISQDLADFDRRKQEEADRMSRLFESGEGQKKQADKLADMSQELEDFHKKKPRNPFGDD